MRLLCVIAVALGVSIVGAEPKKNSNPLEDLISDPANQRAGVGPSVAVFPLALASVWRNGLLN